MFDHISGDLTNVMQYLLHEIVQGVFGYHIMNVHPVSNVPNNV